MHGRLKVKTTAEQQEEKRKEREKKSKAFAAGMNLVFKNRGDPASYQVVLDTTEKLLSGNPDVYTLWNIRKEIFIEMAKEEEDISDLLHKELRFLQNCLHVNPKSYGVWNQRRFVMLTMKPANWNEELLLCNLFLQYDERNFHCWDHRRFVVKHANISAEEEFDFTLQKIKDNFSNYSAWHNRSKLLPIIKPDAENPEKLDESALSKEFELAQNAYFTDPNDQSAWFYQRWLLGRKTKRNQLLSLSIKRSPSLTLIASFSQAVSITSTTSLMINCTECKLDWKTSDSFFESAPLDSKSCTWISKLEGHTNLADDDITLKIAFPDIQSCPEEIILNLPKDQEKIHLCWSKDKLTTNELDRDIQTEVKTSVLESELESCRILLEEEPDNKWTMLTVIYLMCALNDLQYIEQIEELLSRLIKADPMRTGYYNDLRSKFRIENALQKLKDEKNGLKDVNLSGKNLTCFPFGNYLTCCKTLNLSNNCFTNINFCKSLIGVEELLLSNNPLNLDEKVINKFPFLINIVT